MVNILVTHLILVVLHLDEVGICGIRVQRQGHKSIDCRSFGDDFEGPALLVLELNQVWVILDNFVFLILRFLEELGQCKPLDTSVYDRTSLLRQLTWPAILYRSFAYLKN